MEILDLCPGKNTDGEHLSSIPNVGCQSDDCTTNDQGSSQDNKPIGFRLKKEPSPVFCLSPRPTADEPTATCMYNYYLTSVPKSATQHSGQESFTIDYEPLSVKCECDSHSSDPIIDKWGCNLKWKKSTFVQIPQLNAESNVLRSNQFHTETCSGCYLPDYSLCGQDNLSMFDVNIPNTYRESTTDPSKSKVTETMTNHAQTAKSLLSSLQIGGENFYGTCTAPAIPGISVLKKKLELYKFSICPIDTSVEINKPLDPPSLFMVGPTDTSLEMNNPQDTPSLYMSPIGTPLEMNKPLDTPSLYMSPMGTSLEMNKPLATPLYMSPIGTSLEMNKPLDTPTVYVSPMGTSLEMNKPLDTPSLYMSPIGTSLEMNKPLDTPLNMSPIGTSLEMNTSLDLPSLYLRSPGLIPQEFTITNMIGLPLSCTTKKRPRLLAQKSEETFIKPEMKTPCSNFKQYKRSHKFRYPLQPIHNFVHQSTGDENKNIYTRKKIKKSKSNNASKRKEKIKKEPPKPVKLRKPLRSIRSAERCDPNFKGAIVCLKTQVKDENCYLDISACFCNMKSQKNCGLTKKPWQGSGSLASMQEPGNTSEEEGLNIPPSGFCCPNENVSKTCASCSTRRTPLWRDAEDGTPLCNACGIRFKKYRVRCSKCWHIPKKDIKTYPNCPHCGSSLRMSFSRKSQW